MGFKIWFSNTFVQPLHLVCGLNPERNGSIGNGNPRWVTLFVKYECKICINVQNEQSYLNNELNRFPTSIFYRITTYS